MSHRSRVWLTVALLCSLMVGGVSPLRADYIVCYVPDSHQSRISCQATCQERERLVQSVEGEWAGCSTEVPYCGTAWSEWGADTDVGGSVPQADPCPAGCWRTLTMDGQFRTVEGERELRVLWQCHEVRAAG